MALLPSSNQRFFYIPYRLRSGCFLRVKEKGDQGLSFPLHEGTSNGVNMSKLHRYAGHASLALIVLAAIAAHFLGKW